MSGFCIRSKGHCWQVTADATETSNSVTRGGGRTELALGFVVYVSVELIKFIAAGKHVRASPVSEGKSSSSCFPEDFQHFPGFVVKHL